LSNTTIVVAGVRTGSGTDVSLPEPLGDDDGAHLVAAVVNRGARGKSGTVGGQ
jgi:hypothetical protein